MSDVPLYVLADEVDDRLGARPVTLLLSVSQTRGVVPATLLSDRGPRADSFAAYKVVRPGDVVLNRFNAYRGSLGVAREGGMVSPDYAVLRAHDRVEPRFLEYWLRSAPMSNLMKQTMGGLGSADPDSSGFSRIDLRKVKRAKIPPNLLERSLRIADYLDHETAEIDAFIADLLRLRDLSVEEREMLRSSLLLGGDSNEKFAPLKRLARVTVGIVVEPSRYYTDNGVPTLRGLNVSHERVSTAGVVEITLAGHAANSKSELATGDVVVVRTGQAGAAAVVPPECNGWNAIDLLIVKPHSSLRGEYLAALINSRELQSKIQHGSVGAIQAHFNVESLGNLRVPFIPASEQDARFAAWSKKSTAVQGALADIDAAIALAKERRAALITAAVTGQIDVTTKQKPVVDSIHTAIEESR